MQNPRFLLEESTPEPSPFDLFLEERAKRWEKALGGLVPQWDVLICFPTFRKNALEEWKLLEKESAAQEGLSEAEIPPSDPRFPLRLP